MLVDNKFIYLNIPRCASTSFHITCLKNNIDLKHFDDKYILDKNKDVDLNSSIEDISLSLTHSHENITNLRVKFGSHLPVIAVKRNRHERFISLWKHIINICERSYPEVVSDTLKSLTVDDLLFYKTEDLVSVDSTVKIINEFFVKVGLNSGVKNSTEKYGDEYFVNMMYTLFQPESVWHNNDSKVIWFDFNKLNEMEDWVSNKIGKNFKLERCNTSSYCNPKLVLNDEFIEKYNNIYNFYDLPKTIKTLI